MRINYNVERKDVFAFHVYTALRAKPLRVIFAGCILFQVYVAYAAPVMWLMQADAQLTGYTLQILTRATMQFAINMTFVAFLVIVLNGIAFLMLSRKFKKGDGSIGQHMVELNESSLMKVTDVNQTSHSWKSVQRIVDAKKFVLIYVSPTNAHIIPKREFASLNQQREFLEEARRLKENASEFFAPSYLAANS